MCFRLLAAIASGVESGDFAPAPLERLRALASMGARHGLDLKPDPSASTALLSVCWGDCACSLYTGAEGRKRLVSWAEEVLAQSYRLQLLFFDEREPFPWSSGPVINLPIDIFRREGMGALTAGKVTELTYQALVGHQ
jgi:hypothetical protein